MDQITTNTPLSQLRDQLSARILGQEALLTRLLVALLADGHLLVEGAPGLAKTTAIKALGEGIDADFQRIQFTPDLLPADLTGSDIFLPDEHRFQFQPGPLFHNLLLADEINRAPAKVQSALLEAMGERQITVGGNTYPLPKLFLVMATQNPIEQEGTYPLPEAQLDRFLMYVRVGYPQRQTEREILRLNRAQEVTPPQAHSAPLPVEEIFAARRRVFDLYLADSLEEYLVELVTATRDPEPYAPELATYIAYGASPRATIALDRCARAHALLAGRDYVSPEDIHAVAPDVLRHRVLLSFEAEAEGLTADDIVDRLLRQVPVP